MGSISTDRDKGISHKDYFQQVVGDGMEILDASVIQSVCYMAARTPKGVIALVAPFQWSPNANFNGNFTYRVEDETMGPSRTSCPERILAALSPLHQLYEKDSETYRIARQWREKSWQRIFEKRAKPKARAGDVVRFSKPIKFVNGVEADTFTFVKRSTFRIGGEHFRISSWREEREYEIIERAAAQA